MQDQTKLYINIYIIFYSKKQIQTIYIYSLDLPFGIEFSFLKKVSGNMLVSLVFASVGWFCFSEYKIKHTQKKKKRSERGNWSSSMVWFCLLE